MSSKHGWENEAVFHDGDDFFSKLFTAISQARENLDLETYIFGKDHLGQKVLKSLKTAAARGVKVRLLLDGFGCSAWFFSEMAELEKMGIETRFFHPLPWQRHQFRICKDLTFDRVSAQLGRLNHRNHRKTFLIDKDTAFIGSMNVTAHHLKSETGKNAWRDTSAMVQGKEVSLLHRAFENAWRHNKGRPYQWQKPLLKKRFPKPSHHSLVRVNVTRAHRRAAYLDLLFRLEHAKVRIWITNPYFVPHFSLIRTLRKAAAAGVEVRILLSRKSDVWGIKWAIQSFYLSLLSGGVHIFEYCPRVLHAKVVIIDDWATVGSTNLNQRSLHFDLEADVVLGKAESIASLKEQFLADLKKSEEIHLRKWKNRNWLHKLAERSSLIFRKWL